MPSFILYLEYTCLENDVEEEVEGVTDGNSALDNGCGYDHFIETLANDLEPVRRVSWSLHRFTALLEFHHITNTVLTIHIIESIAKPTVRIANTFVLIKIAMFR